jgi:hypothetical protein
MDKKPDDPFPQKTGRARGGPTAMIGSCDWLIGANRKGMVRISGIVNFRRSALRHTRDGTGYCNKLNNMVPGSSMLSYCYSSGI